MKNILIAVWDTQIQFNLQESLGNLMLDATLNFASTLNHHADAYQKFNFYTDSDFNNIIKKASDTECDYLLILASGCFVIDESKFNQGLSEIIDKNILVAGHILHTGIWQSENNPEFFTLHEQTIILKKDVIDMIKNITFSNSSSYQTTNWRKVNRSIENMHDDYTPLKIWPSNDTTAINMSKQTNFGVLEDLLQYCMHQGIEINNINFTLRKSKKYSYHIQNSYEFEKFLHSPRQVIMDNQNSMIQGHFEFLSSWGIKRPDNVFWAYNSEYLVSIPNLEYDSFVGVASGCMPWIYIAKYINTKSATAKLVDISPAAIKFQQWFIKNYEPNKFSEWSDIIKSFIDEHKEFDYKTAGDSNMGNRIWNEYKNLVDSRWQEIKTYSIIIEEGDIIEVNNYKTVLNESNQPLVWFSNVFRYTSTFEKNYKNHDIENYLNKLFKENIKVMWQGDTISNGGTTGPGSNIMCNEPVYKLNSIPKFDTDLFLKEIEKLEELDLFTKHRGDMHPGWSSFVLHGLGYGKTQGYEYYGYSNDEEAPYDWTSEALEHCPSIVNYFKEVKLKNRYHRVRIMKLAPGGYISMHDDDPKKVRNQWANNIAINNPDGCEMHFWNETFQYAGMVPWKPNDSYLIRIHWKHMVRNLSKENRYHIIVHGT
jgi:hypothetical protein